MSAATETTWDETACPVCAAFADPALAATMAAAPGRCPRCGTRVVSRGDEPDRTLLMDFAQLLGSPKPKPETHMDRFLKTVEASWKPYSVCILDLSGVEQLNSMWMGRFVLLQQRAKAAQKNLLLIVPKENRYVMQAFEVTRLDKILSICEDAAQALAR